MRCGLILFAEEAYQRSSRKNGVGLGDYSFRRTRCNINVNAAYTMLRYDVTKRKQIFKTACFWSLMPTVQRCVQDANHITVVALF